MTLATFLDFLVGNWLWLAAITSLVWGARGVFLFAMDTPDDAGGSFRKKHPNWDRLFQGFYQFMFNSVGSFAGWLCLYVLAVRVQGRFPGFQGFGWGDVLLFVFALLGLTGHLPQAVVGFLGVFQKIGEKVAEKIG